MNVFSDSLNGEERTTFGIFKKTLSTERTWSYSFIGNSDLWPLTRRYLDMFIWRILVGIEGDRNVGGKGTEGVLNDGDRVWRNSGKVFK